MKRSDMTAGVEYAVYTFPPVPTDPYSDSAATLMRRARVVTLGEANIPVVYLDAEGRPETVAPAFEGKGVADPDAVPIEEIVHRVSARAVVCPWETYLERRAERHDTDTDGRRDARLERESTALGQAQAVCPTARLADGCIVIPVDDWLRATEEAGS